MEEKDGDAPCDNPFLGNVDYDNMTEEEYYAEMEKKVEYYKKNYPDMYEKAQQWIKMLDHSQVYKENSGEETVPDTNPTSPVFLRAQDILKNMNFNGLTGEDLTENEMSILCRGIPNWKELLHSE